MIPVLIPKYRPYSCTTTETSLPFRYRYLVWCVAVNFVGTHKDKHCLRTSQPTSLEQIQRTERIDLEITRGISFDLRLRGAVYYDARIDLALIGQ
jgi:hypothetical protein